MKISLRFAKGFAILTILIYIYVYVYIIYVQYLDFVL